MATTLGSVTTTARDFSRAAGRRIDKARDQTGGALHAVASSMRRNSSKIDRLASGAAKRLDATASFVEDGDFKDVFAGLRRFSKNHPACALLAGAAVGFWAGSAISRMARSH